MCFDSQCFMTTEARRHNGAQRLHSLALMLFEPWRHEGTEEEAVVNCYWLHNGGTAKTRRRKGGRECCASIICLMNHGGTKTQRGHNALIRWRSCCLNHGGTKVIRERNGIVTLRFTMMEPRRH